MKISFSLVIGAFCIFLASSAHSGTVMIPGASGGDFVLGVTSFKEMRFKTTIGLVQIVFRKWKTASNSPIPLTSEVI